jgi:hypothetical protein
MKPGSLKPIPKLEYQCTGLEKAHLQDKPGTGDHNLKLFQEWQGRYVDHGKDKARNHWGIPC